MGAGDGIGNVVFCICGPKGSLCCTILSVWGSVMLFLLGIFYYIEAVVLLEDFVDHVNSTAEPILGETHAFNRADITDAYHKAAYSCFGAGAIYLAFLILSGTFLGINIWRAKAKGN